MKTLATCFFPMLIAGSAACGNLMADSITLTDLPTGDIDTISIQLNPLNGAVNGVADASVGWGFTVNWTSTQGDWVSFTSTSLGSLAQGETNPSLLSAYTDFIGLQGGPVDFGISPGSSAWTEAFDGVSQGVGAYQITSDLGVAIPGAEDTGQITFDFQVYNGDPLNGTQIGNLSGYSYYGSSTAFSVTVDAPAPAAPEPSNWLLFSAGLGALYYWIRSRRSRTDRTGLRRGGIHDKLYNVLVRLD
jgi:hypothetical protein